MEAASGSRAPVGPRSVMVSGYPSYTQPQDLTRVFSKFGTVKVDRISQKMASLVFTNEDEASEAIAASGTVNVYGEFLKVKPYNPTEADKPQTPKMEFTKSKLKGRIIEASEISLSGPFHSQLERALAAVRLSQPAVARLARLYHDLEAALRPHWPGCSAVPFGSITTGLGIKTSDADCFIDMPERYRVPNANFVYKTKRILMQYPEVFDEILAIPHANTPIVKFFHVPTGTNCDVTFKTPLGARNSRLVGFLLHADPRLVPMAVLLKYWAKLHELSGTGKLTNYALTLLIIFYLQQPPVSLLPSVAWLQAERDHDDLVDYWNTGFMNRRDRLPPSTNTSSISELLGGFFEYYTAFNFEEMVVCPFIGSPIKKDMFKDSSLLPREFEQYKYNVRSGNTFALRFTTPMCVQDPFEQCHNVASAITNRLATDIKAYLKFAADAYEKEKLNECEGLLRTILLQKPKIIHAKTHPEYRVHLFPKVIANIADPEWKPAVQELVLTIFEQLFKIQLEKLQLEDKPNPEAKKKKEKYAATLSHPIWKRKQFNRLYNSNNMTFVERQARITDEIIYANKQPVTIQFQMSITYNLELKSAVVVIRFGTGDVDSFREFGKFFMSVLLLWFNELTKQHTKLKTEDSPAEIPESISFLDKDLKDDESDDDSSYLNFPPEPAASC